MWLAQKFGREVEQGQLIDLRLTHTDIAEVIGGTRVTVTRLLSQFEQDGIINRPRRHCRTCKPNASRFRYLLQAWRLDNAFTNFS